MADRGPSDAPKAKALPSYERVRELFNYDPGSGLLIWRISTSNRAPIGSVAGARSSGGRLLVGVDGKRYKVHRIIWLWMTGSEPPNQIDHEDVDPSNNCWANLRGATNSLNMANRGPQVNKLSHPLKGAYRQWNGSWYSRIKKDGVGICLGTFETPEAAHAAYLVKARELFGEFARGA